MYPDGRLWYIFEREPTRLELILDGWRHDVDRGVSLAVCFSSLHSSGRTHDNGGHSIFVSVRAQVLLERESWRNPVLSEFHIDDASCVTSWQSLCQPAQHVRPQF